MDKMILEKEMSVIAAIGGLNTRGEANAHGQFDVNTDDIRIDFTATNVHECVNSLYNGYESNEIDELKPWTSDIITDKKTFSARIGPTGGKRGYSHITGIVCVITVYFDKVIFYFYLKNYTILCLCNYKIFNTPDVI